VDDEPLAELVDEVPEPVPIVPAPPAPKPTRAPLLVAVFLISLVVVGLGVLGVVGLGRLAGSRSNPDVTEPSPPTPAPVEATATVGTEPGEPVAPKETAAAAPTTVRSRAATPRSTPQPTPRPAPPTSPKPPSERSAVSAPSEDVTLPKKLSGDSVKLPRGTKLPATVLVEFFVLEDGRVSEPRVVESGGETLDAACLAALLTWRYQPAMKGDLAVKHRQQFRFTFRGR
jgi:TonB family protein